MAKQYKSYEELKQIIRDNFEISEDKLTTMDLKALALAVSSIGIDPYEDEEEDIEL